MDENNYEEVEVAGSLEVPGISEIYYLLHPEPLLGKRWMVEDERVFYVAVEEGVATQIIVKGTFIISYACANKKIKIRKRE